MREIRNHGPGTRVEAMQNRQQDVFFEFMRGAERSARDMESTKEPDGLMAHMFPLMRDYGGCEHYILGNLIFRVAKKDPEMAWAEFESYSHERYQWVYRQTMLESLSRGLADDSGALNGQLGPMVLILSD